MLIVPDSATASLSRQHLDSLDRPSNRCRNRYRRCSVEDSVHRSAIASVAEPPRQGQVRRRAQGQQGHSPNRPRFRVQAAEYMPDRPGS